MSYTNYTQKLKLLLEYIHKKQAVSPMSLAGKLGVSERTVLRMIAGLREGGYPVHFCRKTNKYLLKE